MCVGLGFVLLVGCLSWLELRCVDLFGLADVG